MFKKALVSLDNLLLGCMVRCAVRGFSLMEVALLVLVVTVVVLPVVASVNQNSHSNQPSIPEVMERQESLTQAVNSLITRAVQQKVMDSNVTNTVYQFGVIDALPVGTPNPLLLDFDTVADANLGTPAAILKTSLYTYNVPLGVSTSATKPLFKFRWLLQDVSYDAGVQVVPDGFREINYVLQVYAEDTTNPDTATPVLEKNGSIFVTDYSATPPAIPTTTPTVGVVFDLDMSQKSCYKRKLSRFTTASSNREWLASTSAGAGNNCQNNTTLEPVILGMRDWFNNYYSDKNNVSAGKEYYKRFAIAFNRMDYDTPAPTPLSFIENLTTTDLEAFIYKDVAAKKTSYSELVPISHPYISTWDAQTAITNSTYSRGVVIHIVGSNLNENGNRLDRPTNVPNTAPATLQDLVYNYTGVQPIKHYFLYHLGINQATIDYFDAIARASGGKTYCYSGNGTTTINRGPQIPFNEALDLVFKDLTPAKSQAQNKF
jgi:hypothetical protein